MWSIKLPDYYDSKRIAKGISLDQLKTYMSKPDRSFMNGIYSDVDNVNGKLSDYSQEFQDWYGKNKFSTYWGDSDIPMLYNWWFNQQLDDNYKAVESITGDDATPIGTHNNLSQRTVDPRILDPSHKVEDDLEPQKPHGSGVVESVSTHSDSVRPTSTESSISSDSSTTLDSTSSSGTTRSTSDDSTDYNINDRINELVDRVNNAELGDTVQTENTDNPATNTTNKLNELIDDVNSAIDNGYQTLFGFDNDGIWDMFKSGSAILGLISTWSNLAESAYDLGLSEANRVSLAQSVYNTIFSLVNQQITQDLALRNWYMQQDYNSPVSAIARLMEAGINPAYYYESMNKSAAGEIASGTAATPATSQFGDNMTNGQRKANTIIGALSGVGGTVQALLQGGFGGATAGIKNLADSTATLGSLQLQQNLQPFEIGQLQANTASTWAQKFLTDTENAYKPELYKAQQYQLMEQAKNYSQQIDMMQKDLDNKLSIAQLGSETQLQCSENQALATVISANLGALAAKYTANKNYQSAKYTSDNAYKASVYGTRMGLAGSLLPHVYTHQRVTQLYDASTGKKLELSAEESAKLNTAILKGDIKFKEGVAFEWNNRSVRGYQFDTNALDVLSKNGMNEYFNNLIEICHTMGKDKLDPAKSSNDASDFLNMYNHVTPYVNKAAAAGITNTMMFGGKTWHTPFINPSQFSGRK